MTREHIILARQVGVEHLVVAINKADQADAELLELVELELRDLLEAHGYDSDDVPMVAVSARGALEGDPAWEATIMELLDAVDTTNPLPGRSTADRSVLSGASVHCLS